MIVSLLAILGLVLLNGAFVAAEFALVSCKDARLGEGRAARLVRRQRASLDEYLSACQLGITVASLALGALGEPTFAKILRPLLHDQAHLGAWAGTVIALLVMTALHITAGEQAPKSFAIGSAEKAAKVLALPLHIFYLCLRPLVITLNKASNGIVRLFGAEPAPGHEGQASLDELRHMIGSVEGHEDLDRTDHQMLRGVFTLDERCAADVMTPRHRVSTVESTMSVTEALACTRESGHSRFPVIGAGSDESVVGVVTIRELVNALMDGSGDAQVSSVANAIIVTPRNQKLDRLLDRMRAERVSLCAVLDEYGQLDGVIAIEDIVEEVVGEIWDEDDLPETIERAGDGSVTVTGDTSVVDLLSEGIDLTDEAGDFDSVGGLIHNLLGEIPVAGDKARADGYMLTVETVDGHRIETVRIEAVSDKIDEAS